MRRQLWLGLVLVAGCSRSFSAPSTQTVVISPAAASAAPGEHLTFSIAGGTPPYSASLQEGSAATASVTGATLEVVLGTGGNVSERIVVRDASGRRAPELDITVGAELTVVPALAALPEQAHLKFTAFGGKSPYDFSLDDPTDGGSKIDRRSGDFTAGGSASSLRVKVSDAAGQTRFAAVQVTPGVAIFPQEVTLVPGQRLQFQAIGGQPPYRWTLHDTHGAPLTLTGGGVDASGLLQLPPALPAGDLRVAVTDGLTEAEATVHVGRSVGINVVGPPGGDTTVVASGTELDLVPTGGVAPFTIDFADKGNLSGATLTRAGHYVAGPNPSQTDRLRIRDGAGGQAEVSIHVRGLRVAASVAPPQVSVPTRPGHDGLVFVGSDAFMLDPGGQVHPLAGAGPFSRPVDVGDFNRDGVLDVLDLSLGLDAFIEYGTPGGSLVPGPLLGNEPYGGAIFTQGSDGTGALLPPYVLASAAPSSCPSGLAAGPLNAFLGGTPPCLAGDAGLVAGTQVLRLGPSQGQELAVVLVPPSAGPPFVPFARVDLYAYGAATPGAPVIVPTAPLDSQPLDPAPLAISYAGRSPRRTGLVTLNGQPALVVLPDGRPSDPVRAIFGAGGALKIPSVSFPAPSFDGGAWFAPFQGPDQTALLVDEGNQAWLLSADAQQNLDAGPLPLGLPAGQRIVGAGDFDGDGAFDLALQTGQSEVSLLLGSGMGGLPSDPEAAHRPGSRFAVPPGMAVAATIDLLGDGGADLLLLRSPSAGTPALEVVQGVDDVDSGRPVLAVGPSRGTTDAQSSLGVAELAPHDRRLVLSNAMGNLEVAPLPDGAAPLLRVEAAPGAGFDGPNASIVRLPGDDRDMVLSAVAQQADAGTEIQAVAYRLVDDGGLASRVLFDATAAGPLPPVATSLFDVEGTSAPDLVVVREDPFGSSAAEVDVARGLDDGGLGQAFSSATPIPVPLGTQWLSVAFDPPRKRVAVVGGLPSGIFIATVRGGVVSTATVATPALPSGVTVCLQEGSPVVRMLDLTGTGQGDLVVLLPAYGNAAGQACGTVGTETAAALVVIPVGLDGSAGTPVVSQVGQGPYAGLGPVLLTDLNHDGRIDVVSESFAVAPHLQVFAGQADLTFVP